MGYINLNYTFLLTMPWNHCSLSDTPKLSHALSKPFFNTRNEKKTKRQTREHINPFLAIMSFHTTIFHISLLRNWYYLSVILASVYVQTDYFIINFLFLNIFGPLTLTFKLFVGGRVVCFVLLYCCGCNWYSVLVVPPKTATDSADVVFAIETHVYVVIFN